jgi:ketosteroid isomerase-like protein
MAANTPEELETLARDYARTGDLAAWVSLFEPGAVCLDMDGEIVQGHVLRDNLAEFAAMKPEFEMKTRVINAGDIALIHNEWSEPAHSMSGYAIQVARRQQDGTWRYVIDDLFTIDNRIARPVS